MNLRDRARLVVSMTLLIVVVLYSAFLFFHLQKTRVERATVQMDTLMVDSIQLRGTIFDYLLHRETRPRLQVEAKLGDLHSLLENQVWLTVDHPLHDARSRFLWEDLSRLLAECETLFSSLNSQEAPPALREHDQRTEDLLLLSSQSLNPHHWSDPSHGRQRSAESPFL